MNRTALACTSIATLGFVTAALVTAGPLDPPAGPVAATYKTLTEVEPRTAINSANTPGDAECLFKIAQPGSYYLTANITGVAGKHAIRITASNVTLDLNGFAISGTGNSARGIDVPTLISGTNRDITIRNGTIQGWLDGGVRADLASGIIAEDLRLLDNVGAPGLALGAGSATRCTARGNATGFTAASESSFVECTATRNSIGFQSGDRVSFTGCVAVTNTSYGFTTGSYVSLLDCTAGRNGDSGFVVAGSSTLSRCTATRNIPLDPNTPGGSGISTGPGCTVSDCTGSNNTHYGILAGPGCTITDCTAGQNGLDGIASLAGSGAGTTGGTIQRCSAFGNLAAGINVGGACLVLSNTCDANARGIIASGDANRIDGNSCTNNTFTGYSMDGVGNLMIRNTAHANGANFASGAFSIRGLILINSPGSTINSSSAWSNIEY